MLGSDVCAEVAGRGHVCEAPSSTELDITDPTSVAWVAGRMGRFDWCINCAGYTAVDKAESEPQAASEINAIGAAYLADACGMAGIKLIHLSTDFVFDGRATEPYREDAPTHPLSVYGKTKRDGELSVRSANPNASVVRASWLYGPNGQSFPRTMIRAWEAGKSLRVVSDQKGCPTYTGDLARVLVDMAEANAYPDVYHACGPVATTWHGFAVATLEAWRHVVGTKRSVEVEAIPTEDYPTPATRPKYSVLATSKVASLGIVPMRSLDCALARFVSRLAEIGA